MTGREDKPPDAIRWSIKWKFIVIMTIFMIGMLTILSYIQISSQKRMLEAELDKRIVLMKENLSQRGRSFIANLSRQVENDIASFNFSRATELIKNSVKTNKEVKYAVLMDASGIAHIHTHDPDLIQTRLTGPRAQKALDQRDVASIAYQEGDKAVIEMINPIQVSTKLWGVLRLIYTLKLLNKEIANSREELQQELNGMIYRSVLTSVGFMGVCFIIVFILASKFASPLIRLTESARKLSKGDFSASSGVSIRTLDEVGLLAKTFTQMSKDLETSYKKLEDHSRTLEEKVEERTKELNQALKDTAEAKDRIDGILKSVADGLIVTDIHNRVILMNSAAEDLLGVSSVRAMNQPIDFSIADKRLREKLKDILDKKSTGYYFDFQIPHIDSKHPSIMRARTSVIHNRAGAETGIVTIINDVTHEREVDRMKTEFISTAAHELRSPLTSIQGFSDILMTREDLSPDEKKRFMSYINKQSIALTNIINDLLDISLIESGRGFALQRTSYDAGESIHRVISYYQEQYSSHGFDVTLLKEPLELFADMEKMEQVFKNLLSNAVKYSPDGGMIRVAERLLPDRYEVTVEDQGVGMSPEEVEKIFDKFYRADASDTGIEGTGLGMTIVQHIIEAHNGEVNVESELGKGTCVRFSIPLESRQKKNGGKS